MVTPMAENRTPRDMETRDAASRPKSWAPPSLLPEVNQEPGYSYRWIRISTLGTPDVNNISSKFREGWEPVKASEHPEAFSMSDPNSRFKDAIESGGLILCKTPVEFTQQRDAHYRKQTEDQVASVDNNFMRENDPRMPLFKEKRSTVTFGSGSK
jgi:hypothetical protein